jgi:hypothetical protein
MFNVQNINKYCKQELETKSLPYIQPLVRISWYRGFILYCTLRHVRGGNSCGVYAVMGVAETLTGLWSTQAKVEGIMLRAAWCCGRDSSVVNDHRGESVFTPLYVGLPSVCSSVDGDLMFFLFVCGRALFWGLRQIYRNE